ncbi:transposase [Clostridia bacterium OttesenSCG-928-O13]|nr:transposase [Clostridia bacterium OttesenSCG-928-O13]
MAKGKYQKWLEPNSLVLLQGWARDGCTDEELAKKMNISPSTLYEWVKKYLEISEAIKKGKEVVDYEVENALLKKALGGDVTAMIFWLKNRKPQQWRDKPIVDRPEGEDSVVFVDSEEEMQKYLEEHGDAHGG